MSDFVCEVCNREPGVALFPVAGMPKALAVFGEECINRDAEPYPLLRYTIMVCGGPGEVNPEYLNVKTYMDGEYMTLEEALENDPMLHKEKTVAAHLLERVFVMVNYSSC